jgi:hypothetical protein
MDIQINMLHWIQRFFYQLTKNLLKGKCVEYKCISVKLRHFCNEDNTKPDYVVQHDVDHGTNKERKLVDFPLSIWSKQSMRFDLPLWRSDESYFQLHS